MFKNIIGNSSICISGNKVTINGKTIKLPSNNNISVVNGKVFVDGKEVDTSDTDLQNSNSIINISIEGNVDRIDCSGSVEVKGNVSKGIDCGGSVSITGDVNGDIDCGGSANIKGSHKGDIDAGGSVSVR